MKKILFIIACALALIATAPRAFADQIFAPQAKYYLGGETYPLVFRKDGVGSFPATASFSVLTPAGTLSGAAYRAVTNPLAPGQSGQLYLADLKYLSGFAPASNVVYTVNFGSAPSIAVQFSGNGNRELLERFALGIRRWTFGTVEHWSGVPYLADMMREIVGSASNHISVPNVPDRNGACLETLANGTTWCNPALSAVQAQGIIGADGADMRAYPPHAGLTASEWAQTYDALAALGQFGSTIATLSESLFLFERYNFGRAFAALVKSNGSAPFNINQAANAPTNNTPSAPNTTAGSDDPLANFSGFYTCTRNANLRLGLADLAMSLLSSSNAADQQMIDTVKAKANAIASFNSTCDDYSPTADLETTVTAMKVNFAHWMLSGITGSGTLHSFNPSLLASQPYRTTLENLAVRLAELQIIEGEAGPNSSGPNGVYGYFAKTTNAPDIFYAAPLVRYWSLDAIGRIAKFITQYGIPGTLGGNLKTIMDRFIDGYVQRTTVIDPAVQPIAASPWHPWEIVRLDGTTEGSAGGYTTVAVGNPAAIKLRHYRPYSADNAAHPRSNEFAPGMALTLLDMADALSGDPGEANRVRVARIAAEKLIYSMFGFNPLDKVTVYGGTSIKTATFARVGGALPCYMSGYPSGCGSAAMGNADHFFTQNGIGTEASDFGVAGGWMSDERHEQKVAATLGALRELYEVYEGFDPAGSGYAISVSSAAPIPGGSVAITLSTTLPGTHIGVVIANVSAASPSQTPLQTIPTASGPAANIYIPQPWLVAAQGTFTASAPLVQTYTLPAASAFSYPPLARLNLQAAGYYNGAFATPPSLVWSAPIALGGFGGQAGSLIGSGGELILVLLILIAVTSILAFVALPKRRGRW